ncbi:hypothetical protein VNO80_11384 [Phaseolus coccineus]|uniref:Uncharacterized protein n=1 Tax=Phaseolus coccineus TaxID=3886 RepID=A0AAN9REU9_PHACN
MRSVRLSILMLEVDSVVSVGLQLRRLVTCFFPSSKHVKCRRIAATLEALPSGLLNVAKGLEGNVGSKKRP